MILTKYVRNLALAAVALLGGCAAGPKTPAAISAAQLYEKVTPSLVVVQYTYEGEFGRRDFAGAGVVVSDSGLVMTSMRLFPLEFPDSHMRDFRIIIPGDDEVELEAVLIGRDERTDLAFLRPKQPRPFTAVRFEDLPVSVGQSVYSVGLLPKDSAYKSYIVESQVAATLRGPVPQVMVSADGLATVGSPVFNTQGQAIGLVPYQPDQSALLNADKYRTHELAKNPPRFYVPSRDFLGSLSQPPAEGKPMQIPWLGAPLTGLKKEVAELFNLKGQAVVLVGDVIPDTPAAKAGLKAGDKIVKLNGQPLQRGDEPEETPQILMRTLRKMDVGARITLTVMRDADKPLIELPVTLEVQPRQPHQAKRWFAEDLGFSVREVVFADTYSKKLPANQAGVVIAFVRQGGSAASARLSSGDVVTKLNNTQVKDLEQFKSLYQQFRKNSPRDAAVMEVIRERSTEVIRIEPPQ
jgi:serine protease Do